MRRHTPIDTVVGSLAAPEAEQVRAWLRDPAASDGDDDRWDPLAFLRDRERASRPLPRPRDDDPAAIRRVGVLGGGTAGYFAALALRAKRPWLDVTVVESSAIGVIGVGESTVQSIVPFLHHYLGIDPQDFYQRVQPTWKLGIKFDWGPAGGFMAPFDWSANTVGILGSLATRGDINGFTLQSLLMAADRTPVFDIGGEYASLMTYLPFSYHLDNQRFVRFLAETAQARGIHHVDAAIDDVVLSGPEHVDHVRTADGRELAFDFYVDCTGFRSLLLGKALGTPFHSYADSLFTDSAVIGNVEHGGHLKPYTGSITMSSGWAWNIPTREDDHLGYVYSSAALGNDAAADELASRFPGVSEPQFIRFRSGRHAEPWRGNVMAIGNAYAFVEPLESSSLLMITLMAMTLAQTLPASAAEPEPGTRSVVNTSLNRKWDALRWFLAAHYRFNGRSETPFWRQAREHTDVSGIQPLLDVFADGAPLQQRDPFIRAALRATVRPFYDLGSYDCILHGLAAPTRLLPMVETVDRWHARQTAAEALVERALPQREALIAFDKEPALLAEMFSDRDSWAHPQRPIRLV